MGLGTKICVIFCCLNGLCGLFIAYLFDIGINSMAITAAERRWDRLQKAKACRHAGILYFILAVILAIRAWQQDKNEAVMQRVLAGQSLQSRMWEYNVNTQEMTPETAPLLGSANTQVEQKGSEEKSNAAAEQKSKSKEEFRIDSARKTNIQERIESEGVPDATINTLITTAGKEQGKEVKSTDAQVFPSTIAQREQVKKGEQSKQTIALSPAVSKNYGTVERVLSANNIKEKPVNYTTQYTFSNQNNNNDDSIWF